MSLVVKSTVKQKDFSMGSAIGISGLCDRGSVYPAIGVDWNLNYLLVSS